jgi:hypothetical protein
VGDREILITRLNGRDDGALRLERNGRTQAVKAMRQSEEEPKIRKEKIDEIVV